MTTKAASGQQEARIAAYEDYDRSSKGSHHSRQDKRFLAGDAAAKISHNTAMKSHHTLDARGLLCPEPVMMLHAAVRKVADGEVLKILTTDASTQRDIPKFCQFLGYELIEHQEMDGEFIFWISKAAIEGGD